MIFNLLSWLVARIIDGLDAGTDIPDAAATWGIACMVAGAVALTWIVTRAVHHRAEREEPAESLTESEPWLAERAHEEPPVRMRRTHRYPIARHVPAPKRVPGPPPSEWQTITLPPSESQTTVIIPTTYGGVR